MSPSEGPTVFATANLDTEIPKDFAIYEISRLLGTLSLFEHPLNVGIQDNFLTLKQGRNSVKYVFCNPVNIFHPAERKIVITNVDIELDFLEGQLYQLQKGLSVLSSPMIGLINEQGKFTIKAIDTDIALSDSFQIDFDEIKYDNDFRLYLKVENLKLMPGDYKLQIGSTRNGTRIVSFIGTDIQYWIAIDAGHSKWEK